MPAGLPQPRIVNSLSRDSWLLFATRSMRLFAYGLISVVLMLYLKALGLTDVQTGTLLSLTMLGDTLIGLWITTRADGAGRRHMLIVGSLLMAVAGLVFVSTSSYIILLVAATVGVLSPSGGEVGPFLPIEQAALAHTVPAQRRTSIFAWYNLVGSVATAFGALAAGQIVETAQSAGLAGAAAYEPVVISYAIIGFLLAATFWCLSPVIEVDTLGPDAILPTTKTLLGLHRSRGIVARLSALFALDAFGGGFILQAILAYWLNIRFNIGIADLGWIFFGANLLAGVSALAAGRLAGRFGLVNTMVFTHLPSNVLLMLIPFMPTAELAVGMLLLRFSISQMDVPTRQAYTVAVVEADERSAAAGITSVARSLGAAVSPAIAARLVANPALVNLPLLLAGGIKIVYDIILWRAFASLKPEHERELAEQRRVDASNAPPGT